MSESDGQEVVDSWHHMRRRRRFTLPSPASVRQKQTPKHTPARSSPREALWSLQVMGLGSKEELARWLYCTLDPTFKLAVKRPTVALASKGTDPAEPVRSRPPSPGRAPRGCDEADTACPGGREVLYVLTVAKKSVMHDIYCSIPL